MDIREVTYTDDEGVERNAYDYLAHGPGSGDIPGGRYATRSMDAAEIAIMLFLIFVDSSAEDSIDALDGAMSMVVNGSDEVCWTILDSRHAFSHITAWNGTEQVPLDPTIYFDDEEIEYARELYTQAYCGEAPSF
jgi:hypothetical protein